jgi:hypothetical protein
MSGFDCACLDCVVDRMKKRAQYIAKWADGRYYVRDNKRPSVFHSEHRSDAALFGPTHIKIFGKHLAPELVKE